MSTQEGQAPASAGTRATSVRAGIVVTGNEVLNGRIQDSNGPWISERLAELGVEVANILVVADRPDDLESALRYMESEGLDLVVTSGGLGPTADDLTAEVVARFAGREMRLDQSMEDKIAAILRSFASRLRLDQDALLAANRKQAMVPEGATAIDPAGTAPGLVVPAERLTVIVLPGPPRELQAMWDAAIATQPAREVLSRATPFSTYTLRMIGIPESEIAKSLREIESGTDLSALEITTCLRRGEIEIDVRYRDGGGEAAEAVRSGLAERHDRYLFSEDGTTVDELVAGLLAGRRLGLAESCSGGLLAARITSVPGASAYLAGSVVAYSNEAKVELLGVDAELIEKHGAVSPQVAEAMARGALERFEADVAVSITGIAGPDGGTKEKPVGYVCLHALTADGEGAGRDPVIPGSRQDIRERSALVGMHMLRLLLGGGEGRRESSVDEQIALVAGIEAFEVPELDPGDLRARLSRTRWPSQPRCAFPPDSGGKAHQDAWDLGADLGYVRELCEFWAKSYDSQRLPGLLNRFDNFKRDGIHFIHESEGDGLPLLLLHGWPGGPIEYLDLIPLLQAAGHPIAVPSLPGFAWSDDPGEPLNIAAVSARIRDLVESGLGWERYGVVGGDWGAPIGARIAFDSAEKVAGLYVYTPGVLPPAGELGDPPLTQAEGKFVEEGLRWRRNHGHHMIIQSSVPDILSVGLNDSPAGLAAYLVDKYRSWSDCDGDVERRFSKDQLCDYLTMYWSTETIGSSMRLYWGERSDRWRPGAGETIDVPAACGIFPAEIINPPREWTARLFADLRSWTEMPRGGHFAAHEEPELLAGDALSFFAAL